jgi:hypothetical protein
MPNDLTRLDEHLAAGSTELACARGIYTLCLDNVIVLATVNV